ncbi:MAG: DUF2807 domain-containing protein [Bacteroidetes bacterium]|nr:DUF2807 domain-containing protein [Bacteroidota bacterium]
MKAVCKHCFCIAFLGLLVLSCKKENGCYVESGKTETRIFNLPEFHTINHSVQASFILNSGPQQEVKVTGNKNILKALEKESYVENGIWNLAFESCVGDYDPLIVELTLPSYVGFTNNGIGNTSSPSQLVAANEFSVSVNGTGDLDLSINSIDKLNVLLNGTGNITLSGSANQQYIEITGNGVVNCFGVTSNTSDVTIKGNGNCMVLVNDSLNATIAGGGIIYYKGYPVITQSIQGPGSVIDAN